MPPTPSPGTTYYDECKYSYTVFKKKNLNIFEEVS
jgi:hypothetical protein